MDANTNAPDQQPVSLLLTRLAVSVSSASSAGNSRKEPEQNSAVVESLGRKEKKEKEKMFGEIRVRERTGVV